MEGADRPQAAAAAQPEADRLRVFISYGRVDSSDFAEYLVVALKLAGFDAYLDRHDIAKAEDFEQRIGDLIAKSDTVIFIIAPASIASPRCEWEVNRTVELGKRLVPLQWIAVPEKAVPVALKRLNYTVFSSGEPFHGPLAELVDALRQDLPWLRQQTQFGEQAQRWDGRGRDPDLLLRGTAVADARGWMQRRKPNAPEISSLVAAFIGESEQAQELRRSEESQQLKERQKLLASSEVAQRERAEALARAEEVTAEKAELSRRVYRRTVTLVMVAVVLAAIAVILLYFANEQRLVAESRRMQAEEQERRADQQAYLAREETARADQFVNLVSSNPAGRRAMDRICLEAVAVTTILATTSEEVKYRKAEERFWELYYASMYIIELHQTKTTGTDSKIEERMIEFGEQLEQEAGKPLPHGGLCSPAETVRNECVAYLKIEADKPCP